ncbi:MAG: aryl-sulfate sulfotransferase [Alphaproteobacteria bacterium]|nr:aryl-sulfate sulfotransferase [Alphaproteobacteria bacterium]
MKKHSVVICGHSTSFSLEEPFWEELKDIAKIQNMSLASLITQIDATRTTNLSSALRVFAFQWVKEHSGQN